MKSQSQIKQQLKQAIYRHRKRYIKSGLSRVPENCKHHGEVRLPVVQGGASKMGVCQYVDENGQRTDLVCDEGWCSHNPAHKCPNFSVKNDPETLKSDFAEQFVLDDPEQIGRLARIYPDVVALMWVLDESSSETATIDQILDSDEGNNE
jgi:hypothetical protein